MILNYKITEETKEYEGKILKRISYLNGEKGGWIEKESNLSQNSSAIIEDEAMVMGDCLIDGNSVISGNAIIKGSVIIDGDIIITDNAIVDGQGKIYGRSSVFGNARVTGKVNIGNSNISLNAKVHSSKVIDSSISQNAEVSHSTIIGSSIRNNSRVMNLSNITSGATIRNACIDGASINEKVILSHREYIRNNSEYAFINLGWGRELTITKEGINCGNYFRSFKDKNDDNNNDLILKLLSNTKTLNRNNRREVMKKILDVNNREFMPDAIREDRTEIVLNYIFRHSSYSLLPQEDRNQIANLFNYQKQNVDWNLQEERDLFFDFIINNKEINEIRNTLISIL